MNKPLEEINGLVKDLFYVSGKLDEIVKQLAPEEPPEDYEELDDEDYVAVNDIATCSNPVAYNVVRKWVGASVAAAKASNPGYRFYRKKAEETDGKWRFLKPDEIVQEGDWCNAKENQPKLPVTPNDGGWVKCKAIGHGANVPGLVYARRIYAEPAAEPEPKYRYDHHIGKADYDKQAEFANYTAGFDVTWHKARLEDFYESSRYPKNRIYVGINAFGVTFQASHCRIEEAQ